MNCSWLTASTAGTLSTAKMTSVSSTSTSTANSGVASRRPLIRVNRCGPSRRSVLGIDPVDELEEPAVARIDVLVVGEHHTRRGEQQERPEHVEDPVEPLDQGDAGEDEDRPHHEGPEDAPEQHPVLVLRRHLEVAHDQRPDEDVVDAQALLDEVAGDVLAGRRPAEPPQHDQREADADRDPHRRLDGRLACADGVRLAVHDQQVDQQQGDDQRQQDAPLPQRGRRGRRSCSAPLRRRAAQSSMDACAHASRVRGYASRTGTITSCRWPRRRSPARRRDGRSGRGTASSSRSRGRRRRTGRSTRGRRRARRTRRA